MQPLDDYHVFGMGKGESDLHYIGWTTKPLNDADLVCSSLATPGNDVAHWIESARCHGQLSIFEIESVQSPEAANDSVAFWCQYFRSLGLNVKGLGA